MVTYGFHPEALAEYSAAAERRLQEGSAQVAEAFVTSVESAVQTILSDSLGGESLRSQAFDGTFCAFPLRHLLPLGSRASSRYYLRCHALQSRAWLLEAPDGLTKPVQATPG